MERFEIGDRVRCIATPMNKFLFGKIGTVKGKTNSLYLVEFDDFIGGYAGYGGNIEVEYGHSWNCFPEELEKIKGFKVGERYLVKNKKLHRIAKAIKITKVDKNYCWYEDLPTFENPSRLFNKVFSVYSDFAKNLEPFVTKRNEIEMENRMLANPGLKIVVTTDGFKTITAKLYNDRTIKRTATARCHPDDYFDFEYGSRIAINRLINRKDVTKDDEFVSSAIEKIAWRYGATHQSEILVEECAELIQAVQKCKRNNTDISENLKEEIADVMIMCLQMREFVGKGSIDDIIVEKLQRQLERIEEEKK